MKNKIEVIKRKTSNKKCYICNGSGFLYNYANCDSCNGTGIFKDNHYILIANGMAFDMDSVK